MRTILRYSTSGRGDLIDRTPIMQDMNDQLDVEDMVLYYRSVHGEL